MSFKTEVIEKIAALMTVAFGLIAALAWNSSVQALFRELFGTQDNLSAMFGYAVLVTILAVLITIWIARISAKALQEEKKPE
ncbi:hypothetical protein RJ53_08380 [Methanocalculus chunghsingensis]|uniref:Uncharacterized protein n=1 Tax=Methanocalculus chunghsingensis TaxID=156457 RepID=A0A8J8B4M9_9EURY|nr:DUF5654 family protein [Methanocalculus chunghsingensis]MBR1369505.1 hypothetical protein [Methanocalculus chunghsingensis]